VHLFLEPRSETSIGGTIGVLSNDPLVPSHTVQVVTDIRALDFDSKLLGSAEKIPLGEAVTVEVTPAPQVHLERGFVHYRPGGTADGFPGEVPLVTSVNEFIAVIPGGDVTEAGLEYYVSVENSGVVATDPPGAPADPQAFFTQAVQGPTAVVSTPRPNSSLGFASGSPIYVDVALAQGTGVVDGFLHYRIGGGSEYESVAPSSLDPSLTFVLPDTAAGPAESSTGWRCRRSPRPSRILRKTRRSRLTRFGLPFKISKSLRSPRERVPDDLDPARDGERRDDHSGSASLGPVRVRAVRSLSLAVLPVRGRGLRLRRAFQPGGGG